MVYRRGNKSNKSRGHRSSRQKSSSLENETALNKKVKDLEEHVADGVGGVGEGTGEVGEGAGGIGERARRVGEGAGRASIETAKMRARPWLTKTSTSSL